MKVGLELKLLLACGSSGQTCVVKGAGSAAS